VKTKLALALTVIAAVVTCQSPASAQRMAGMRGGGMFGGPMMAAYLGLTQDQMSQLKTMRATEATTIKPLMQQMGTYRQQLDQMTQSTNALNSGALQTLANEMAQIQAQLTVARAQMQWQIYNKVLTEDQQAKLASFQQQMQQMRQNWKANSSSSASPAATQ
jgi:capsule polysaccharide export protein KpsE/RkpR